MIFKIVLSKEAQKDLKHLKAAGLEANAKKLRDILALNPYMPPYEKLTGDLIGQYSRRINLKHRLVYEIFEDLRIVKISKMWGHYE